MIDEHLAVPLETTLSECRDVKGVDVTERDEIVAICSRARSAVDSDPRFVLPSPAPVGASGSRLTAAGAD